MVGSFLHLYGEPVKRFRRARRVQQTKGWTLTSSDIYVTNDETLRIIPGVQTKCCIYFYISSSDTSHPPPKKNLDAII